MKKLISMCLLAATYFLAAAPTHSQEFGNQSGSQFGNTSPTWFKRYGGETNYTEIEAVRLDGDSIIAGGTIGTPRVMSEFLNMARTNINVMRLDLGGGVIWSQSYSPKGVSAPTSTEDVAVDAEGNIIVIATARPERENLAGTSDTSSAIVLKLDASGQKIWQREHKKYLEEKAQKIIATADGGYLALIQVEGDNPKARLIKISKDGAFVGESEFAGSFFDLGEITDGFMLMGRDKMIKLDTGGRALNTRRIDAESSEIFSEEQLLFHRSLPIRGDRFMPVLTLASTDGTSVWKKRYHFKGKRLSYFRTMARAPDGFIVSGTYREDFGVDGDVFVLKLSEGGEPLWMKELTSSTKGTLANDILLHPESGFFIGGAIDWEILMNNRQQVMGSEADAYLMRVTKLGQNENLVEVGLPRKEDL